MRREGNHLLPLGENEIAFYDALAKSAEEKGDRIKKSVSFFSPWSGFFYIVNQVFRRKLMKIFLTEYKYTVERLKDIAASQHIL